MYRYKGTTKLPKWLELNCFSIPYQKKEKKKKKSGKKESLTKTLTDFFLWHFFVIHLFVVYFFYHTFLRSPIKYRNILQITVQVSRNDVTSIVCDKKKVIKVIKLPTLYQC